MYSHIQDLNTDQLPHGQLVITEEKHLCFSDVTIWKFRKKNKTNQAGSEHFLLTVCKPFLLLDTVLCTIKYCKFH